jgi:hypothetical protein
MNDDFIVGNGAQFRCQMRLRRHRSKVSRQGELAALAQAVTTIAPRISSERLPLQPLPEQR